MADMTTLHSILNDTPANAVDVDFNFQVIEDYVNTELIKRDGTIAMDAPLQLPATVPSAPTHAANKAYVDALIPVGVILPYGGAAAPAGWAICDGAEKSITDPLYSALFAVIGYSFGTGAGSNFKLPNFAGRMPIGLNAADGIMNTVGETGGSKDTPLNAHTHTGPSHSHAEGSHQHTIDHDHAAASTDAGTGAHVHGINAGGAWTFFSRLATGGTLSLSVAAGTEQWASPTETRGEGGHVHTFNIPNFTGLSGAGLGAGTGLAGTGATGSAGSGTGTNTNLPPYITTRFIIRL